MAPGEVTPTLYILRGLPGSGKSTEARRIRGKTGAAVCSTDDYFVVDGKYCFDYRKLSEYHARNFKRAKKLMEDGQSVVLDNTNVLKKHYFNYVTAANRLGISVVVRVIGSPKDPESWLACAKRNTHGVGYKSIRKCGEKFEL